MIIKSLGYFMDPSKNSDTKDDLGKQVMVAFLMEPSHFLSLSTTTKTNKIDEN